LPAGQILPGQNPPGQIPADQVYAGQGFGQDYAGGNVYAGGNPGRIPAGGPPEPQRPQRPRRPLRTAALVAAAVVVVAGAAAGGWVLAGRGSQHPQPGPTPTQNLARTASPSQASPSASASLSASASPSASPSSPSPQPSPTATVVGTVTVASSAAQNAAAPSVAALVNQYFAAINAHDYQAYVSLLTAQEQQGMTATQFANGYQSTSDSDESLTGISSAADGDTIAMVTFTSHQNPADSVNGAESCTDWQISLFLAPSGGGYLIDQPPSGYHASYAACP
jgi:hypothetical protein